MKGRAEKKRAFCDALVHGQSPETAAKAIGVARSTVYLWRAADAEFARQWDDARERKIEAVENTLYRMAVERDLGAICFFLKAHRPELYNRRQVIAIGGDLDNPLSITHHGTDEVVHFFLPSNGRDQPEELEVDEQPPAIEGTVEDEAEDAA